MQKVRSISRRKAIKTFADIAGLFLISNLNYEAKSADTDKILKTDLL
ncbi:MAG: hypothetical protein ACP5MG_06690 [Verrucomicrobiia bacterium]